MKKLFTGVALLGTFALAFSQTINFDKTTMDYGTVKTGADGNRIFVVKNTGDKPLIISNVKPSCGCTVPDWSKDPIEPGKTAEIKVHYNTNSNGKFTKQIEVFSNDPQNGRTVLTITGNVDPNAKERELTPEEKKALAIKTKEEEIAKAQNDLTSTKQLITDSKEKVKTLKSNLKTMQKELKELNK